MVFVEPGTGPQGYKEGESVQLALRAGGSCDQNGEDRCVLSGKIQKSGERALPRAGYTFRTFIVLSSQCLSRLVGDPNKNVWLPKSAEFVIGM